VEKGVSEEEGVGEWGGSVRVRVREEREWKVLKRRGEEEERVRGEEKRVRGKEKRVREERGKKEERRRKEGKGSVREERKEGRRE
jgi:hypothetical protein